jgi:hypothetical protein
MENGLFIVDLPIKLVIFRLISNFFHHHRITILPSSAYPQGSPSPAQWHWSPLISAHAHPGPGGVFWSMRTEVTKQRCGHPRCAKNNGDFMGFHGRFLKPWWIPSRHPGCCFTGHPWRLDSYMIWRYSFSETISFHFAKITQKQRGAEVLAQFTHLDLAIWIAASVFPDFWNCI